MDEKEFRRTWATLTHAQRVYLRELPAANTKAEAAKRAGLNPRTVYGWPSKVHEAGNYLLMRAALATAEQRKDNMSEIETLPMPVRNANAANKRDQTPRGVNGEPLALGIHRTYSDEPGDVTANAEDVDMDELRRQIVEAQPVWTLEALKPLPDDALVRLAASYGVDGWEVLPMPTRTTQEATDEEDEPEANANDVEELPMPKRRKRDA